MEGDPRQDDLVPDRLVARYTCGQPSCGIDSVWRRSFPDAAFEKVEEMERFFREHILGGIERRCASCQKPLRASDLREAEYSSWSGRVGQELLLEMKPRRRALLSTYPVQRFFLRGEEEREAVQSPHDPRLRSAMIDSVLRGGALLSEESGRSEEGMVLIRRAIELDPDHALGHARLGEALFRDGRIEEAEEASRAALHRDSTAEIALDLLARICHSTGRWAEAETNFQRARLVSEDRPDHLLGEARAQVRLGRHQEAFQTALELLRQGPAFRPAVRLAAILARDVQPAGARPLLQRMKDIGEKEGNASLRQLAEERLALLPLPLFRPKLEEEPKEAFRRMEEALRKEGIETRRWKLRGKEMPGRKVSLHGKTVYLNCFHGRFDEGEWNALVDWLREVRGRAKKALVQIFTALPCPYAARKIASALPEALLDLQSEKLLTPGDPGASAQALVEAAAPLGDLPEDLSPAGLETVDRILLERFHDDGFGRIRPPTALLFAHYAGEVIRKAVGGGWVEGESVHILQTPQGGIDPLAKVEAIVTNGPEDSLAYLLEAISGS